MQLRILGCSALLIECTFEYFCRQFCRIKAEMLALPNFNCLLYFHELKFSFMGRRNIKEAKCIYFIILLL